MFYVVTAGGPPILGDLEEEPPGASVEALLVVLDTLALHQRVSVEADFAPFEKVASLSHALQWPISKTQFEVRDTGSFPNSDMK